MDRLLKKYIDFVNQDEEYRKKEEQKGRDIVDRIIEKYDTTNVRPIIEEQTQLDILKKIAFRKFPPLLPGETIFVREVKERLSELKRAGYDIKPNYNKLKKKEAWNYFRKIRRDISSHFR